MTEPSADPQRPAARSAFAVAAFFALTPAFAVGGAIGLPVLMALAGLATLRPDLLKQAIENNKILLGLFAALLAWLSVTALWSPWDGTTFVKAPATAALGLLFASATTRPHLARLSLAGALAALVVLTIMLTVEAVWDSPLNRGAAPSVSAFQLNQSPARGAVVMLALTWPALAWLIATRAGWRWPAAAIIVASVGFVSVQFGQLSTAFGLVVGGLFFAAAWLAPRLAILAPAFGLAVWALVAPFVAPLLFAGPSLPDWLPHSWAVRIGIWRYTSARILEQPWFGHGLDAGRATTERASYDGEVLRVIPVHPHSATMQIWYDAGLVGALLTSALIALAGIALARSYANDKIAAAAAAAVLAMFGMMANIGWSPFQEWWMATVILAGALVAAIGVKGARG